MQKDGLLRVDQQQKVVWGKCGPAAEWDRGPDDKGHRKDQCTQFLRHFSLSHYNRPSVKKTATLFSVVSRQDKRHIKIQETLAECKKMLIYVKMFEY